MDWMTPRRGNELLARGNALGNPREKFIRPDGAKAILHTVMLSPFLKCPLGIPGPWANCLLALQAAGGQASVERQAD